jgi:RNA polymerase sigma-70 factor, ECF subfamily
MLLTALNKASSGVNLPTKTPERVSTPSVTDDELVERTLRGDSAAFGELVFRHGQAVYRAALAALGSATDAEDVMQEAFLLAFRKLPHFRHDASFKTWLLTITWRRALRWRHSPARRLGRLVSLENWFSGDIVEHRPTPEQSAVGEEIHRDVLRLIRSLPSRLRDPLLLSASGRYSYEELSDILDVPTGTVKWRVSEARRLLRAKLARLGHGRSS